MLAAAKNYRSRGWSPLPVPHKSKNPGFDEWPDLRLTMEDLPKHFNGRPQNIGILMGEPSGWLVDVDLDHVRAAELAPAFLLSTPSMFGRKGKPRSHWLYHVTAPIDSKVFKSKCAGTIVEIRSTGGQTVFPPSTHPSGEAITWVDESAEPAQIDPQVLYEAVLRLAETVKAELGQKQQKKLDKSGSKQATAGPPVLSSITALQTVPPRHRETRCLAAMRRITIVDHKDGSHRLFACACRAVEHDLDDQAALAVIRMYSRERQFPKDWSDDEILKRVRDAEGTCKRGQAFEVDGDGCIALGERDPITGRLILSPRRTLPTAQAFLRDFYLHPHGPTLHCHLGMLLAWQRNCFREIENDAAKKRLQAWLHDSLRYVYDAKSEQYTLVDFQSNPNTVNAALESIRSHVHLPASEVSPSWLGDAKDLPPANEVLACRSILLHLLTMKQYPATPMFFTTNALDFDPDSTASRPEVWHQFLFQLFDDDMESIDLLQEWFGYSLIGNTSLQKMLLIVGPRRSGKGTIARILTRLVGIANVCGPTTSSLAGPFGLQPLISKSLAIVSDARFHGENISTVVERLLCISGEDALTVDRKYLESITTKLPTRFMFLTNEFPRLTDASGALAGRFVILRLTESFYGREDPSLTGRLLYELPGILNWAIEGWRRLQDRGRFVMPASVQDVVREIEDLSSPVAAFVREECVVGSGHRVPVDAIYLAWNRWCQSEGRTVVTTKQTFGRDLAAAVPGVARKRGTDMQPFYSGIALC